MIEDYQAELRGNPIVSLMVCNETADAGRIFAVGDLIDSWPFSEGIAQYEAVFPAKENN
jgi:hypothetical protein